MQAKHISIFILFFLLFGKIIFSQTDSIVDDFLNNPDIIKKRENVISVETIYTINPLMENGYGSGITYEHLLNGRKSLAVTGKVAVARSVSEEELNSINYSYFQMSARFYVTRSAKRQKLDNKQILIVKTMPSNLMQPRGGYIGPVLLGDFERYKSKEYNPLTNELLQTKRALAKNIGMGVVVGYQWIVKNVIAINIDCPFGVGYYSSFRNWQAESGRSSSSEIAVIAMLNINLGFSF